MKTNDEIPTKKLLDDLKKSEKSKTIRFKNGKEALEYLDKMIAKQKRNNRTIMKDETELLPTEHHMAADHAMDWFKNWQIHNMKDYMMLREAVASTALSGNRLSNVLHGTLERLAKGEPVSDRYLLGLCWYIKEIYIPNKN